MRLDESQCLGCVYIVPAEAEGYDVDVYAWVRKSAFDEGLDGVLFGTVRDWLATAWPVTNVRYPGRM
jgi:hypothetical protein